MSDNDARFSISTLVSISVSFAETVFCLCDAAVASTAKRDKADTGRQRHYCQCLSHFTVFTQIVPSASSRQ